MKFDFIIGNPPYQDEVIGENKTFAPPIYHKFLENAYSISDVVEMIHPARFLFNAGNTPKQWNKFMLSNPHLKVLYYEKDSSKIFTNTEIKGGIAITYHAKKENFGEIGTFTAYPHLNSILGKVKQHTAFKKFSAIVVTRTAYKLTESMHSDHPEAISQLSNGHAYDMSTNIFERLPQIFFDEKPNDKFRYIQILGRENNERIHKYIRTDYVNEVCNLYKYKIFLPSANGNGSFGETLSSPTIAEPGIGATETFVSIGSFVSFEECNAALKYIKTKFTRALLGVLKVTQHITPEKWAYVPLQDFTQQSDIDWSKSIKEIDQQLYAKYNLDENEIDFIESHVKEMSE
ncbi:MAG: restriction endonuclease [Lachnospiraceae bacterium]|nr:restriction endonuclease [Lachnospiraceae bacterium]